MKKIFAFGAAVICCFSMLVACGKNESSSQAESMDSERVTDSATAVSESTESKENHDEYVKILCDFFSCGDPIQMLSCTLPDDIIESMKNIGGIETISETMAASAAQAMSGIPNISAESVEYISEAECNPEIRSRLEKLYSAYYGVYKTMDDIGISYEKYIAGDIDEKGRELLMEAQDVYARVINGEDADIVTDVKFEDAKAVTFSIGGEPAEFLMYKISGENWKLDTIGLAVFEY